jgi:hypothetical protein
MPAHPDRSEADPSATQPKPHNADDRAVTGGAGYVLPVNGGEDTTRSPRKGFLTRSPEGWEPSRLDYEFIEGRQDEVHRPSFGAAVPRSERDTRLN